MTFNERAAVGSALDEVRDVLEPYVDEAMTIAFGPAWNEVVSEENAKRYQRARTHPVSKSDLAVLLQQILHRRISPWADRADFPRVRAYVSEVLSLRHIYAHGGDCLGEHARLVDTGTRLLRLLELRVPRAFAVALDGVSTVKDVTSPRPAGGTVSVPDSDLGEEGTQLLAIFGRAVELAKALSAELHDSLAELDPEVPDFEAVRATYEPVIDSTGAEVIALLERTFVLENARGVGSDADLDLLTYLARAELLSGSLLDSAKLHLLLQENEELDRVNVDLAAAELTAREDADEFIARMRGKADSLQKTRENRDRIETMLNYGHSDELRWRALIQLASGRPTSHPFASNITACAELNLALAMKNAESNVEWQSEALPLVRDAVTRFRFIAAGEPGSILESGLIQALRFEGEICNDLGLVEEAIAAFARTQEIIDRYPTADPLLQG